MIFEVMLSYTTDSLGMIESKDSFLSREEREYKVLEIVDEYYSSEIQAGYEIWRVEADKASDIIQLVEGVKHQLQIEYDEYDEPYNTWIPLG